MRETGEPSTRGCMNCAVVTFNAVLAPPVVDMVALPKPSSF
jgi:hypothetical protein